MGIRVAVLLLLAGVATFSADAPALPLSVCEVVRDLQAQSGKGVAVIGRYSFRANGSWISEQSCDPALEATPSLQVFEDPENGPKPPDNFELDGLALRKKLTAVQRRTTLAKFRFGTPDYDRWAVVYGMIKPRSGDDAKKAAANLIIRSTGVIVFLTTPE